LKPIFRP